MNILILGATGFIGENLVKFYSTNHQVYIAKINEEEDSLTKKIQKVEIIINAAGVSRSEFEDDFFMFNIYYSQRLFTIVNKFEHKMYIYFSSIHYYVDTIYGVSKRYNEFLLNKLNFQEKNSFLCLRIPSIFGPGMKPNYVSVVATFCYNIANQIESKIIDGDKVLQLLFIDDLIYDINDKIVNRKIVGYELLDFFPNTEKISVQDLYERISNIVANGLNPNNMLSKNLFTTYNYFVEKE